MIKESFDGKLVVVGSKFIQVIEGEFDKFGKAPHQIVIG